MSEWPLKLEWSYLHCEIDEYPNGMVDNYGVHKPPPFLTSYI